MRKCWPTPMQRGQSDTLRSIALSAFGDADLWYLIADGFARLAPSRGLRVDRRVSGQALKDVCAMYAPDYYAVTDHDQIAAQLAAYPLASLCRNGPDGPVIAHVPLVAEVAGGRIVALIGHIARANPFAASEPGLPVVAIFAGPSAYVSPSAYPSKAEHGRVVPTWAYIRVELRGRLLIETDPQRMRPYVEAPTRMMESGRAAPWSIDDAPADYTERLLGAIVGLRIDNIEAQGAWKLNQGKGEADRLGTIAGLEADGGQAIATAMRQSLLPRD